MSANPYKTTRRLAAGYVRVSQVGGREGESFLSPDVQREKIEAWAAYRGFTVAAWYTDLDRPAKERDVRPEFDRMMADAAAGQFEAVAVYRLTRFARSVSQAAARYAELRRHGVALVSVTEDIDTTTASGQFMQNILFSLSEFESQRIGEEWRNVHAARRRRGIAHAPSGIYGYRVEGAEPVAPDDEQAHAVRLMFNMRARGEGYGQIQAALEREGFRSPRGHPRFAKTTILAILRNPVYAGLVPADGELIQGRHPALVSREQFERVQSLRASADRFARHHSGALLAGLLVCHACGYRLRAEIKNGRYRCQHKDLGEICPEPVQIALARADDYVEGRFLRRFDPKRMPHGGQARQSRQQADWARKATRLRTRVLELDRALDALADRLYLKGTISAEEYERQLARYSAERLACLTELTELDERTAKVTPLERDVFALWPTLTTAAKRRALRLQIERVIVKPYTGPPGRARFESPGKRLEIRWTSASP